MADADNWQPQLKAADVARAEAKLQVPRYRAFLPPLPSRKSYTHNAPTPATSLNPGTSTEAGPQAFPSIILLERRNASR